MVARIEAKEKPLADVFCDKYVFQIPPYQRPYAWTTTEAETLLDDLLTASQEAGAVETLPPYFLGSIVLIKEDGVAEADIVDGQQRITTLTILFSVLRDLAGTESKKSKLEGYIVQRGNEFEGTQDCFRLTIRPRDKEYFRRTVQDPSGETRDPKSDPQRNIVANRQRFFELLSGECDETRDRLVAFMVRRCFLVTVEASDRTSAYRIFSVMNDRGLDLSPTDILKADIIGAIDGEEKQDRYTKVWEDLEDGLGREGFGDLFAHLRMIHRRQKMRRTLEAEFKEYVAPATRPELFIDRELTDAADAFQALRSATYEAPHNADEINRLLKGLRLLDNQDWMPPAIAFLMAHRGEHEAVLAFVLALDRLAFSMFIRRANINERLLRYGRILKAIEEKADLFEEGMLALSADECRATLEALDGDVYLTVRTRLPILLRLDEALSDGTARYDLPITQIEHVLPQNPPKESEWSELYPDVDLRDLWTHRLANLVLLSRRKNASASNYDFDRKKEKYFTAKGSTPFVLTNQVVSEPSWTPDVLARRQGELLKALSDLWQLSQA